MTFHPHQRVRFKSLTSEGVFYGTVICALGETHCLMDDHPTRRPRPVRTERLELDCVPAHKGRVA